MTRSRPMHLPPMPQNGAAPTAARQQRQTDADWKSRSHALLETAGMMAGLGYWELDLGSGELFWSDETCRIHGLAPGHVPNLEEAIGFYAPEARDQVRAAVAAGIADGTGWQFELPLLRADGVRIWVHSVGQATMENGRPTRLQGAFQDITARKSAELCLAEALNETQAARNRLNTLADNVPGALFERAISATGEFYPGYFSARLPDLLGVTLEEVHNDPVAAFRNIVSEDVPGLLAQIHAAHAAVEPMKFRYRLNHPKTGLRWLETSSRPHRMPNGTITWYAYLHDVTDETNAQRKLAETLDALHAAHDRLHRLAENIPGGLFEYRRHPDGTAQLPYFTSRFAALFGLSTEALQHDPQLLFGGVPAEEHEAIEAHFRISQHNLSTLEMCHRVVLPSGKTRWLQVVGEPCAMADGSTAWFGKATDVTDAVAAEEHAALAEQELRQAHNRINTIMEIAPVGLFELHRTPEGQFTVPFASARSCDLLGYSEQELAQEAAPLINRIHKGDIAGVIALMEESAEHLTRFRARFRYHHPHFGLLWLTASSMPQSAPDGSVTWIGAVYDVTPEVQREAELVQAYRMAEEMRAQNEHLALHDPLTDLPNRRHYEREIEARLDGARHGGSARDCTLIQIDIDHFKQVNDSHGHEAGDQVLRAFADVLREALRPGDFAARLGGDEFSVILATASTMQDARAVVERLRTGLRQPFDCFGTSARITASFGIVHASEVSDLHEELQLYADAALYRAKEAGRNRVEVFSGDLSRHLHDARWLAGSLRQALDEGQLEPWFQPQISATTGAMVGIEALVRWRHPTRGILGPDQFMKTAEQMRLVPEIDRIVMTKTRLLLDQWRQEGFVVPKISFNVSAERVREARLIGEASGLAQGGTRVALELVETIRAEEEDGVFKAHLSLLRAAGIDIEIDDFGSGHTSIIGLMEVRPSALKIDRRLVMAMDSNARAAEMVRTIVQMAGALGIATIAEGVETEAQAAQLQAMDCDVLQGFLFARPLDAQGLRDFALRYGVEGAAARVI